MRRDIEQFRIRGAQVVAIAPDDEKSVARFNATTPMPFLMLADPEHRVFDAYDVVRRLSSLGQRPAVFIVDRFGVVAFDSIGTQQWQIPTDEDVLARLDGLKRGE